MTTEQESLRPLTRDDTEHGVEYVRLSDVRKLVAEREEYRAAMREALEAMDTVQMVEGKGCYSTLDEAITDLRQRLEGTT